MRKKLLRVNNSYESEGSSASSNTSTDTLCHRDSMGDDGDLRDLILPKQNILYSEDVTSCDNYFLPSSEEYFEGFTVSQIKNDSHTLSRCEYSNSINTKHTSKTEHAKRKLLGSTVVSSQESDFEGYPDHEITNNVTIQNNKNKENNYIAEIKNSTVLHCTPVVNSENQTGTLDNFLVFSGNSKVHTVIDENSSNAVDMKILENNESRRKDMLSDLTFNGKIQTINQENSETEKHCTDISVCTPPLFEDDDLEEYDLKTSSPSPLAVSETINIPNEDYIQYKSCKLRDDITQKKLETLRRIEGSLKGLPPPPSFTITQVNVMNEVIKKKEDIFNFFQKPIETKDPTESQTANGENVKELLEVEWPDILWQNHYGLSYNLSNVTEKIELLSLAVIDRYIGAETSSSFNVQRSPSSAKKRTMRQKLLPQSPGNRLSHLARRRAVFSSANLTQIQSAKSALNTSLQNTRQILLPIRKSEGRKKTKVSTPKRNTPGRSKLVRRTPSSRKKLIFLSENPKAGPTRETSKRALFQSPPQKKQPTTKLSIKPELATRVDKSKRVLFSPLKSQSSKDMSDENNSQEDLSNNNTKRKRSDDDIGGNDQKIFCPSERPTPRALKVKSQSFCVTSNSSCLENINGKSLFRTQSEANAGSSGQLNETHKKKLLWAVSQALQKKQIGVKHPNFKQNASILTRVVKRFFLKETNETGGTSQRMLKLANKFVFDVIRGKSAEEIFLNEKARMEIEKLTKITGYITPEVYEKRKNLLRKASSTSLFSENSLDQFNFNQFSQQSESLDCFSQLSGASQKTEMKKGSTKKLPIIPDKSLQNSSSKNNLHGIALRENVDGELRKSAQKNFTGKDQKNVSPYNDKPPSSYKKYSSILFESNAAKAKRQISFDN